MNKKELKNIDFYFINDSRLTKKGNRSDVENALRAGCKIIQYREKNKCTKDMVEEAEELRRLCENRAFFLVNDRVDVALAVDAHGVHLGQDDMPFKIARKLLGEEKIIGLTVHNLEEARAAEEMGADYVGLSPIFPTKTKEDAGQAQGLELVRRVCPQISIPVVAIGGITKENVKSVIEAGADGVAAISAVVCAKDVYKEVSDFIKIIKRNKEKN
ncbi:MAG TPA: thiamine phosphate synthase [Thermoplasmata archaeon]|nr:thiamine phosphate synthase [Thermoplasmata archaeon]